MTIPEQNWKPKNFILDVDGVFTDGKIYYSTKGKSFKVFGADDHDAINLIRHLMKITVVSADQRGFAITKRRIEKDMGLDLHLVGSKERPDWIDRNFDPKECVYMGDGIFDPLVFNVVRYAIAPQNASKQTRAQADFVTESRGAEGAVAEASIHLINSFFGGVEAKEFRKFLD